MSVSKNAPWSEAVFQTCLLKPKFKLFDQLRSLSYFELYLLTRRFFQAQTFITWLEP